MQATRHAMTRGWGVAGIAMLALAGCASGGQPRSQLEQLQYDYSAAIRWNDFQGASTLLAPEVRQAHPLGQAEFDRYRQDVQVTAYRELSSGLAADGGSAERDIEIGWVAKSNMAEHTLRYAERWRYDAAAKRWWLVSPLPEFGR